MSQKSFSLAKNFDGSSNGNISQQDSSMNVVLGEVEKIKENVYPTTDVNYCPVFRYKADSLSDMTFVGGKLPTSLVKEPEKEEHASDIPQSGTTGVPTSSPYENHDGGIGMGHQNINFLRKRYNPRMSVFTTAPVHKHFPKNYFGNGENPVDESNPVQTEINDDSIRQECIQRAHQMKNYVVDYRSLRKSGYFLNCQKINNNPAILGANNNFTTTKAEQVENWLSSLPNNGLNDLKDMDNDLLGEREFKKHITAKSLSSKEESFKRLIVNRGDTIKYTSEPLSPLSYKQLECILETANTQIYDYLEKLHKTPDNLGPEYVSGKIEMPAFLTEKKIVNSSLTSGDSWIERIKGWVSTFFKTEEAFHLDDVVEATGRNILLEPYHGPVIVNGATIESGSTRLLTRRGVLGTVVEEVKAALQAISQALRGMPTEKHAEILLEQNCRNEDPEVMRLTEILQTKEFQKKSTFRTVFGLRNADKLPCYRLAFQRRRLQRRHRGGFLRAVNGWIQRKSNGHGHAQRQRYRILGTSAQLNPAPVNVDQHTDRSRRQDPVSVGLINAIMTSIRSMMPFQLTHAIPASSVLDQRNESIERFRRSRMNLRQQTPVVVPSRYQLLRNGAKSNTQAKSTKVKKIHVVTN